MDNPLDEYVNKFVLELEIRENKLCTEHQKTLPELLMEFNNESERSKSLDFTEYRTETLDTVSREGSEYNESIDLTETLHTVHREGTLF